MSVASAVHLMAKPAGPLCNLDCRYCFYLEKERLFPPGERFLMAPEVLRAYVEQTIRATPGPELLFTWQGGEPLLRGLAFYRQAVALQRERAGGRRVRNTLQTNGVLLDDAWCAFFAEAGFEIGVSLDGPEDVHDAARVDKQGRGSFARVMAGITRLRAHGVPFNVLATVSDAVSRRPAEVYEFFVAQGFTHLQFNPVVERRPTLAERGVGLAFAQPPGGARAPQSLETTPDTVDAAVYGEFLVSVFDRWVRRDVGRVHVMNFEWALAAFMGLPATVCLFAADCGRALVVEHDGSVYSCDHYVYPTHRLGSLLDADVRELAAAPQQQAFGQAKSALPAECRRCPWLQACHGECPKNRFVTSADGEPGLNYLCPAYRRYFRHAAPYLNAMARLVALGEPAARVMDAIRGPIAILRPQPA
ncbi:anaerobic sulfatase maturase [Rubrivivax gelatinosus]|uniref:Anaerobic sulfatase maturase n=1 Tax=Rubrivivax gelatinosus TaxID=28068 RepID=A0ABS1E078_RUBGE|nr:anaerobic sulfatase maturase [Rubrivivax gelatinosus]MBK1715009.1 anaerobic sulfatase maturase [Rubrivivax gelatinosus]